MHGSAHRVASELESEGGMHGSAHRVASELESEGGMHGSAHGVLLSLVEVDVGVGVSDFGFAGVVQGGV